MLIKNFKSNAFISVV